VSRGDASVLIASGDAGFRRQMRALLAGACQESMEALGGADALLKLELGLYAGLVLDRRLPDLDPDELQQMVAAQYPGLPIVQLDSAVPLPRAAAGADSGFDGLMRELRPAAPAPEPASAPAPRVELPERRRASAPALPASAPVALLPGMVGRSTHLADLAQLVRMVAPRRTTVLLLGETGTGKEMVAQAVHQASGRQQRPYVVVNCAAIPEALLESELFGYQRGAFTGAIQSRPGRIQAAHGGTLFLDEIGELPLALQAKLLRFLQEGELQRLGSNEPQKVDVRVVAATNLELLAEVEAGRFRRDLYYRLAIFPIELLPLRRRPDDVLPLARHFLRTLQAESGLPLPNLTAAAAAMLESYPWPGNVRELQHSLERAFILGAGRTQLEPSQFPALESYFAQSIGPSRAE